MLRTKLMALVATMAVLLTACGGEESNVGSATAISREPTADLIVDVRSLASKTKGEIIQLMGSPASCEKSKKMEVCHFEHPLLDIGFIQDKSERITIRNMDAVNFGARSVAALGLPEQRPDFANEYVIRWSRQFGFREIQLFPKGSKVDYAYIKVSID